MINYKNHKFQTTLEGKYQSIDVTNLRIIEDSSYLHEMFASDFFRLIRTSLGFIVLLLNKSSSVTQRQNPSLALSNC